MDELRALISTLASAGITGYIKVGAFVGQSFAIVGDLENFNTLSQILLTFKYISSGGLLQPGNIPFSNNVSVSIKAFWLWINDCLSRNQSRTGGEFNQAQVDEFHEIYRDVKERAEANHENE